MKINLILFPARKWIIITINVLVFLLTTSPSYGQSYEKEFKVYFAWEVKQLDEFIERFNNDEFTFIKGYVKKTEGITSLSRETMIKKLFNTTKTNWNYNDINSFIKQVNSKEDPQFLDSEKGEWFANVRCKVMYHNKLSDALFKLKLETLPNGGEKWVIEDVNYPEGSELAANNHESSSLVRFPRPTDPVVSLSPMSHAIDFMNIDLVTNKPDNIGNFVDTASYKNKNLHFFVNACLKQQIKIVKATTITYQFYQIKGWLIEVKQFNRQSKNSGWLISRLEKLS